MMAEAVGVKGACGSRIRRTWRASWLRRWRIRGPWWWMGLTPTGKRRLFTAHTLSGRSAVAISKTVQRCRTGCLRSPTVSMGVLGTLSALVLGLLISTAPGRRNPTLAAGAGVAAHRRDGADALAAGATK